MDRPGFGIRQRPSCPFDDSALERQRRMGLVSADGKADKDAIAVLCCIYAGQLFDDLCDFYQCLEDVYGKVI